MALDQEALERARKKKEEEEEQKSLKLKQEQEREERLRLMVAARKVEQEDKLRREQEQQQQQQQREKMKEKEKEEREMRVEAARTTRPPPPASPPLSSSPRAPPPPPPAAVAKELDGGRSSRSSRSRSRDMVPAGGRSMSPPPFHKETGVKGYYDSRRKILRHDEEEEGEIFEEPRERVPAGYRYPDTNAYPPPPLGGRGRRHSRSRSRSPSPHSLGRWDGGGRYDSRYGGGRYGAHTRENKQEGRRDLAWGSGR